MLQRAQLPSSQLQCMRRSVIVSIIFDIFFVLNILQVIQSKFCFVATRLRYSRDKMACAHAASMIDYGQLHKNGRLAISGRWDMETLSDGETLSYGNARLVCRVSRPVNSHRRVAA